MTSVYNSNGNLACRFEVCFCFVNLIMIVQYTTDLSDSNQRVHGFLSFTVLGPVHKMMEVGDPGEVRYLTYPW